MLHSNSDMAFCWQLMNLLYVLFICSTLSSTSALLNNERFSERHSCSQLEDLAEEAREGDVGWMVSRATWGAQQPVGVLDENKTPLERVIVSSTLTSECYTLATCALQVRYLQLFGIESQQFFDHPYNYLVGGDGRVYVGRGWDYMAAHTKHNNNRTVGIAFIGYFDFKMPSTKQLEAFDRLVATGVQIGKLSPDYKLQGQCQLRTDNSPGLTLMAAMTSWPHYDHSLAQRCTYGDRIIPPGTDIHSLIK